MEFDLHPLFTDGQLLRILLHILIADDIYFKHLYEQSLIRRNFGIICNNFEVSVY